MKIYDLSQLVDLNTKRFDLEPITVITRIIKKTEACPVNLSKISCSSHAGTHCDAPLHVDNQGKSVCQLNLESFVGRCAIVDVSHLHDVIKASDIENLGFEERMIFKVYEHKQDFAYFGPCAIDLLAQNGVKLLGTNAMSIDDKYSKALKAHHKCFQHDIQIVEGLKLTEVPDGVYGFIGLPLKISGADASPMRAIVFEGDFYG